MAAWFSFPTPSRKRASSVSHQPQAQVFELKRSIRKDLLTPTRNHNHVLWHCALLSGPDSQRLAEAIASFASHKPADMDVGSRSKALVTYFESALTQHWDERPLVRALEPWAMDFVVDRDGKEELFKLPLCFLVQRQSSCATGYVIGLNVLSSGVPEVVLTGAHNVDGAILPAVPKFRQGTPWMLASPTDHAPRPGDPTLLLFLHTLCNGNQLPRVLDQAIRGRSY